MNRINRILLVFLIGTNLSILCNGMKRQTLEESSSSNRPTKQLASSSSSQLPGISAELKKSFLEKRNKLYSELHYELYRTTSWTFNISVKRSKNVAIQSFNKILLGKKLGTNFKRTLHIIFLDELGKDSGGLTREWFTLVSTQMIGDELELFKYSDNFRINIRPCTSKIWKNVEYFEAAGIITGMAVYHRQLLNVSFSKPFLKSILDKPIDLEDLRTADKTLYNSLMKIKTASDVSQMDLKYFQKKEYSLKSVNVTNQNKEEYVRYVISETYGDGIKIPMLRFLNGFRSIIPLNLIEEFNEDELDLLISGVQNIDIENWKENTTYKLCGKRDKQILWFWEIVTSFSNELRFKLLQFVTGSSRVPPEGFAGFKGENDPDPAFTIRAIIGVNLYPEANTCTRTLNIPKYKKKLDLENKLKFVLQQPLEFGKL